jgi:hypothetical protein
MDATKIIGGNRALVGNAYAEIVGKFPILATFFPILRISPAYLDNGEY